MHLRALTPLLLASLLAPLVVSCTGGERNQSGECPADEECSTDTPDGLHFLGAALHDLPVEALWTTAVGGTQEVGLYVEDTGNLDLEPLAFDFDADVNDGNALAVVDTHDWYVTLQGEGDGDDYLRILEQGTNLLYDRIEAEAGTVDHVRLAPPVLENRAETAPLAFWEGRARFGVQLLAADDTRLVDEGFGLTIGGVDVPREAWDVGELVDQLVAVGDQELVLTVGDETFPVLVTVVGELDELVPGDVTFPNPVIAEGDAGDVCFDALAGEYTVAGLAWTFDVTGPATASPSAYANCAYLTVDDATGTIEVTAHAAGLEATAELELGATAAARRAPTRAPHLTAPSTAGERARTVE